MIGTMKAVLAALAACALAAALAACGSSSSSSKVSGASGFKIAAGIQTPATESQTCVTHGGTLKVLDHEDFEHIDPGQMYFVIDYTAGFATNRPLYSYKPNNFKEAVPDMAESMPEIAPDGKTVTIHIRHGVHFSPPVNREVTSADVAYALDRGMNPNVANPYFEAYFKSIEGVPSAKGGPIPGIATPNKYTIVLHLTEPKGQLVADALVLPVSAPVPQEYAKKYDEHKPSEYDNHQVASGPYMWASNSAHEIIGTGYQPGKSALLVRNPNWNASTDYRPACVDRIEFSIGGDPSVIGRQVLEGSDSIQNDTPEKTIVQLAYEHFRSQLQISPGAGSHYVALNNSYGPFTNVNLRKAVWAALDRTAMDKARGGELVTNVMTHFIYPEIPGFEEAGGLAGPTGPQFDYNEHPEGDMAVAEKYMKAAGYPSGKYTGTKTVQIVGSNGSPAPEDAEVVNQALKNLGFRTRLTLVEQATMYSKYCGAPTEKIDVCPSVGWVADFGDPQAVLNVPFNGKYIVTNGTNSNWGLVNHEKINNAMIAAESVIGNQARANAWAKIDKELVEEAVAAPYDWDKQPQIESKNVHGVGAIWNIGTYDLAFTSLK